LTLSSSEPSHAFSLSGGRPRRYVTEQLALLIEAGLHARYLYLAGTGTL
jgi:hypothetical protein